MKPETCRDRASIGVGAVGSIHGWPVSHWTTYGARRYSSFSKRCWKDQRRKATVETSFVGVLRNNGCFKKRLEKAVL